MGPDPLSLEVNPLYQVRYLSDVDERQRFMGSLFAGIACPDRASLSVRRRTVPSSGGRPPGGGDRMLACLICRLVAWCEARGLSAADGRLMRQRQRIGPDKSSQGLA